ncbi:vWA domain-containing protein [Luteolibacter marinus]|uniref:vWA domain-containing protein n=1 Tax=Luteolibacter marinus TaxID=2776705 RepID=UPI0018680860|nr:vWA domain-containing protein [Luteolibacter marinus]
MNPNLTEIAYILDRSGSMQPMTEAAISGFNEFLQEQLDEPGDANLSLLLFDNEFLVPFERTPLQDVRGLDAASYVPRGSTALLDAIGLTIDVIGKKLAGEPEDKRPGKVVVAIFTDGYENASTRYTMARINELITHQRDKYGWEFLFLAANQDAIATAAQLGIERSMTSRSELSAKGVHSSSKAFSRKIRSMRKESRTGEADQDYHKPMDSIVREEEDRD